MVDEDYLKEIKRRNAERAAKLKESLGIGFSPGTSRADEMSEAPSETPTGGLSAPPGALWPAKSGERTIHNLDLGQMLVEAGVLTGEQLARILHLQTERSLSFITATLESGLVPDRELAAAVAKQTGLDFVDIFHAKFDPQLLDKVPAEIARQHHVLPLWQHGNRLWLGMADPGDLAAIEAVSLATNSYIQPVVLVWSDLTRAVERHYGEPNTRSSGSRPPSKATPLPSTRATAELTAAPAPVAVTPLSIMDEILSETLEGPPLSEAEPVASSSILTELSDGIAKLMVNNKKYSHSAFIVMNFSENKAYREIERTIKSTLRRYNIVAYTARDRQYHDELLPNIKVYIHGCDFCIAVYDRINEDNRNANVAFEVGYVLALGKDLCILKDKTLNSPQTDLQGKLYKTFDTHRIKETLPYSLVKWCKDKGYIKEGV